MSRLLDLPREIRSKIFAFAIPWQQNQPTSLAEINLENRHAISSMASGADYGAEAVKFEKQPPHWNTLSSLSLTNQQIHHEVMDIVHYISKGPFIYELDLIYIYGRVLFPTWTYIPIISNIIDTVYVTIRIVSCDGDEGDIFGPILEELFIPGRKPYDAHALLFYHALQVFLTEGLWPRPCPTTLSREERYQWYERKRMFCNSALQNLIIDIAPSLDGTDLKYCPLEFGNNGNEDFKRLGGLVSDYMHYFMDPPIIDLSGYTYYIRGQVGNYEVKSMGTNISTPQWTESEDPFGDTSFASGVFGTSYARWVGSTTKLRLEAGLPLLPLSDCQRRLFQLHGVQYLYEDMVRNTKAEPRKVYVHYCKGDDGGRSMLKSQKKD